MSEILNARCSCSLLSALYTPKGEKRGGGGGVTRERRGGESVSEMPGSLELELKLVALVRRHSSLINVCVRERVCS